jgi:hypothetical protein
MTQISSHFAARRPEGKKSILRDWVEALPPRMQGTLLTAIRGCDISGKHEPVKHLVRAYRGLLLHSMNDKPQTFIAIVNYDDAADRSKLWQLMESLLDDHDAYPNHYLMHLIHSAEIVGYTHPHSGCRSLWLSFYRRFCRKFHMTSESETELYARLDEPDEAAFASKQ